MKNRRNSQQGFIRLRTALIFVGVLVVVAVLVSVLHPKNSTQQRAASNPQGYQAVADQFIKAMSHKDGTTSYNLCTDSFKKTISQTDWQKQLDEVFAKTTGSPRLSKTEPQQDPYNAYKNKSPYRLTYDFDLDGKKLHSVLIVVKDGDSWKVDEMDSEMTS